MESLNHIVATNEAHDCHGELEVLSKTPPGELAARPGHSRRAGPPGTRAWPDRAIPAPASRRLDKGRRGRGTEASQSQAAVRSQTESTVFCVRVGFEVCRLAPGGPAPAAAAAAGPALAAPPGRRAVPLSGPGPRPARRPGLGRVNRA